MTSEFTVAVHSLVYLHHHKDIVYSSEALAENVCTNAARIRKVMAKLKRAGLVEAKEGVVGGYRATRDSDKITLSAVASALDTAFVTAPWKSGNADMECLIASGMADAMSAVFLELDEICRKRLEQITIEDMDQRVTKR